MMSLDGLNFLEHHGKMMIAVSSTDAMKNLMENS